MKEEEGADQLYENIVQLKIESTGWKDARNRCR